MIRRDERSRLSPRPTGSAPKHAHAFHPPSLTYRALALPPGAFAASRSRHSKRARPQEQIREELRVAVWEDEGGNAAPPLSLPPRKA